MRSPQVLVREVRSGSGLSLRALADAAGLATSTVHRIERGELNPSVETLERIAQAAGIRLDVMPVWDHSVSVAGLAHAIGEDRSSGVRMAAELAARFTSAGDDERRRMVTAEPPSTGDPRWDALVAGLAEWLAVRARLVVPEWTQHADRFLDRGWWVTPMESMRAWEYAGAPLSLQRRGVYLHSDSLTNV